MFQRAKLLQLKISNPRLDELNKLFSESARTTLVDNLKLKKDDILLLTYGPKSDAVSNV